MSIAARTIEEALADLAALPRIGSAEAAHCLTRISAGIPREEAVADFIGQLADAAEDCAFDDDLVIYAEEAARDAQRAADDAQGAADEIADKLAAIKGPRKGPR